MAFAKKNPDTLVAGHKVGSGRPCLINKTIQKAMKKKLLNSPMVTVKQLRKTVPGLVNMSMRAIQHVSFKFSALTGHVLLRRLYINGGANAAPSTEEICQSLYSKSVNSFLLAGHISVSTQLSSQSLVVILVTPSSTHGE